MLTTKFPEDTTRDAESGGRGGISPVLFNILKRRGHREQVVPFIVPFVVCITKIFLRSALRLTYIILITLNPILVNDWVSEAQR